MKSDVTICICTFGSVHWEGKGRNLFTELYDRFEDEWLLHLHNDEGTLSDIRNRGLENVQSEYVIFVDADDNIADNYVEEMIKGTADIRVPSVQYSSHGNVLTPYIPKVSACTHIGSCAPPCLVLGNYLVIGAMARTEALRAVGGFRDWPMYEDWDLWARCMLNDATFEDIPNAVYKATVRPDSRNRQPSKQKKLETHRAIAKDLGFPIP